jgi:hypothetical protein
MTNVELWKRNRLKLKGAIVLARRPGDNGLLGLVETSLFMNWSTTHVRFWWTDIISNARLGLRFDVNGPIDAKAQATHWRRANPSWEITVWDAHDVNLPVSIDWKVWEKADGKYSNRNPAFIMRE